MRQVDLICSSEIVVGKILHLVTLLFAQIAYTNKVLIWVLSTSVEVLAAVSIILKSLTLVPLPALTTLVAINATEAAVSFVSLEFFIHEKGFIVGETCLLNLLKPGSQLLLDSFKGGFILF